jgi:hypothetical protein
MMLANPIILPPYADPISWLIAGVAMWAEIDTEQRALWRLAKVPRLLGGVLVLVNCTTWLLFFLSIHLLGQAERLTVTSLIALELLVVVAETLLIRAATRGQLFVRHHQLRPIGVRQACHVALIGNLVSLTVSAIPVVAFYLSTGQFPVPLRP